MAMFTFNNDKYNLLRHTRCMKRHKDTLCILGRIIILTRYTFIIEHCFNGRDVFKSMNI